MTYDELNQYIEHYIEANNTQSAIMLTGPWGCGKSFYIQNSLKCFLQEKGIQSVIVSLYGVKDISEISKNIYLDLMPLRERKFAVSRRVKLFQKSAVKKASIIGSAFVKKLVSDKLMIDLSGNSEMMQKLYDEADLSGKLIILEDMERSTIQLETVLGYVNELAEDGTKILLVANEEEIVHYIDEPETYPRSYSEDPDKDLFLRAFAGEENADTNSKEQENRYTQDTIKYLRTKEKTISDTIVFTCDYHDAIKNIIQQSTKEIARKFEDDEVLGEIAALFMNSCGGNLRTFNYAWEKTMDIYERISSKCTEVDLKNILCSMILFVPKIKEWDFPAWMSDSCLSIGLGNKKYPLYYFCYTYIRFQTLDLEDVEKAFEAHKEYKMYNENAVEGNEELNLVESWYVHSEREVLGALSQIEQELDEPEKISFHLYGNLMVALIACNSVLGYDYSKIREKMVQNVRGKGNHIDAELLFGYIEIQGSAEEAAQFQEFKNEIKASLGENEKNAQLFNYLPSDIKKLESICHEHRNDFLLKKAFLSLFNIEKLVQMIIECNSEELQEFRSIIKSVYEKGISDAFSYEDKEYLDKMLEKIKQLKSENGLKTDRIYLKQIDWLCDMLRQYMK